VNAFRSILGVAAGVAALVTQRAGAQRQAEVGARTRAELVTAREAVWRAYFQGDSAALVRLLPARMTAMGRDRAEIIQDAITFRREGGRYAGMEFTQEEFFVSGNTAVLWSHYVAHVTDASGSPSEMKGKAIELFVKRNGRWINPHWHLDSDK